MLLIIAALYWVVAEVAARDENQEIVAARFEKLLRPTVI
jgi:hypothetical protein